MSEGLIKLILIFFSCTKKEDPNTLEPRLFLGYVWMNLCIKTLLLLLLFYFNIKTDTKSLNYVYIFLTYFAPLLCLIVRNFLYFISNLGFNCIGSLTNNSTERRPPLGLVIIVLIIGLHKCNNPIYFQLSRNTVIHVSLLNIILLFAINNWIKILIITLCEISFFQILNE